MSTHCGYVVNIKELRPHSNADKLQIATFFGNDTCVGLDVKLDDIGIYFPSDLQLSVEFCEQHNLVRRKDDSGNNVGGYLDPDKRNIRTIKLRGEKSDGLFMPLQCLAYTGINLDDLNIGDRIDIVNGHEICKKYIPHSNRRRGSYSEGNKTRKKKIPIAPLFAEHADTEQLAYNLNAFKAGDQIEITLKMHGTSHRVGYLETLQGYKRTFADKIFRREGTPEYNWGYVAGTRRTVLEDYNGGYYGSNEFREAHTKFFNGKLWKGETVYMEIVGFTNDGTPIMSNCENKKLNDKDFIKQYGDITIFSYGCDPTGYTELPMKDTGLPYGAVVSIPKSEVYVYRMTMTNEDGNIVEYTPDFMRYRCEQMGVKTVPVLWKGFIPYTIDDIESAIPGHRIILKEGESAGEWIKNVAEQYYDGPDPVGKTHIREGVVVRIINRPKFCAYKHKNFSFKCLEGIVKAEAESPDIEEAQEIEMEEGEG